MGLTWNNYYWSGMLDYLDLEVIECTWRYLQQNVTTCDRRSLRFNGHKSCFAWQLSVYIYNYMLLSRSCFCQIRGDWKCKIRQNGPRKTLTLQDLTMTMTITFVASPHLQPSEDIWKRFYSLKFLTLPRTFNIIISSSSSLFVQIKYMMQRETL